MSVRAFTLDSGNNIYSDMYGGNYITNGVSGTRQYRNATFSNQNILVRNIARTHTSEFKEAYEYLEDGNISAFQGIIDNIKSTEASKQRTYNIDDSEIASAIEDAYQQVIGSDYDTSIASTKDNSFVAGLKSAYSWVTGSDTKSAAEYSAQRRGTTVNGEEQSKKNMGKVVGTLPLVAGAGICIANAPVLAGGTSIASAVAAALGSMSIPGIGWIVGAVALTALAGISIYNAVKKN